MRQRTAITVIFAGGSFIAGCSPEVFKLDSDFGDTAGKYTLRTVNGQALPATLQRPTGGTIRVLSGSLTIWADGSYWLENAWEEIVSGIATPRTETCSGLLTRSGNSFILSEPFRGECGGTFSASWDGADRLTVRVSSTLEWVFER